MKDVWSNGFPVAGKKLAGAFVKDHQAWRIRSADLSVRVVHAGAGVEIKIISVNEDRAVSGVMRPNAGLGGQVETPEDLAPVQGVQAQHFTSITY